MKLGSALISGRGAVAAWPDTIRIAAKRVMQSQSHPSELRRYLVVIPVEAADLEAARNAAWEVAYSVARLGRVRTDGVTFTPEGGEKDEHHKVFCDRLLGQSVQCILRINHSEDCDGGPWQKA
jgi:hypothetical protein